MLDNYRVVKVKLDRILHDEVDYTCLYDAIKKVNKMTIVCYQFMRLYMLYQYKTMKTFCEISPDFIRMAFKAISKKSVGGRTPNNNNKKIYSDLCLFYNNKFMKFYCPDIKTENDSEKDRITKIESTKFDAINLSYILKEAGEEMYISIVNNVRNNFVNCVNRYVNQIFKAEYDKIISTTQDQKLFLTKKQFKYRLKLIKDDLLNNTKTSPELYHSIISFMDM